MSKKAVLGFESLENKKLLSASNDSYLNTEWGLNSISAFQAWKSTTGSKNEVVAILDSGIDLTHQDLINNIWTNPMDISGDTIDNDNNGYLNDTHGWNFVDNNNDVQDRYGHGSHVAGIIGAEGNNGIGLAGVNWNVSLMPLKVMSDTGIGSTNSIIKAIDYVVMMKEVYHVNIVAVNASWASLGGYSQIMYDEINKLNQSNILFVAAAGNSGSNSDISLQYPSCYDLPNVISVGALSDDGIHLADLSNYGGLNVDLVAPGIMINSTLPYDQYGILSGTSMAAPYVAGAVALLYSAKPDMSMMQVKDSIFSNVDKIPELFGKVSTNGKLDIGAAVNSVLGIPVNRNSDPQGAITSRSFSNIKGWAIDPDSAGISLKVQLLVDGVVKNTLFTKVPDGSFSFNLGALVVGDHIIEVKAVDSQTGVWTVIGSTVINVPAPVVTVEVLNQSRIKGWAFSERLGSSPVIVRIYINNRLVSSQYANQYRPDLNSSLGSSRHGFSSYVNRYWLRKGSNEVKIVVYDSVTKQASLGYTGYILK